MDRQPHAASVRSWPRKRRLRSTLLYIALAVAWAPCQVAVASPCGDLLAEGRVACGCGDTVVSDTRLQPSDPIVNQRCDFDGLTVLAASGAESITLDLGGLTIRGRDMGIGIQVLNGGEVGARILGGGSSAVPGASTKLQPSKADAAKISALGRATVAGFGTGFRALPSASVSRIEHLDFIGNRLDGVSLALRGTIVLDVVADLNGGNGFDLRGKGGRLVSSSASQNHKAGFKLDTQGSSVGAVAQENGSHGLIVDGSGNQVMADSSSNGGAGVFVRGRTHEVANASRTKNAAGRSSMRVTAVWGDGRERARAAASSGCCSRCRAGCCDCLSCACSDHG